MTVKKYRVPDEYNCFIWCKIATKHFRDSRLSAEKKFARKVLTEIFDNDESEDARNAEAVLVKFMDGIDTRRKKMVCGAPKLRSPTQAFLLRMKHFSVT